MWAIVFKNDKIIDEGQYYSCKYWKEEYPEQHVSLDWRNDDRLYVVGENCDKFQLFFDDVASLEMMQLHYDSDEKVEHSEQLDCHYHYAGCTHEATMTWTSPIIDRHVGGNYPCCENCYKIRAAEQERINEKYMNIKPFKGRNEYGEYYDEDSY